MARKIIPRNLKPLATLKYLYRGGTKLRDKDEIIELAQKISEVLDAEQEIEQVQKVTTIAVAIKATHSPTREMQLSTMQEGQWQTQVEGLP